MGLCFNKNELIHVRFTSILKKFVAYCVFLKTWISLVLHDFNLTYYSIVILGSFTILLFPNWHIGLTPSASIGLSAAGTAIAAAGGAQLQQQNQLHFHGLI